MCTLHLPPLQQLWLRYCASFLTFGLPDVVVSDNATGITSDEFESFMQANGVKHICTPPYHPPSNGLMERAMQMLKGGLRKL